MRSTESAAARPAGRPRSERAERAILEATLDLLGEGISVSELSIEAIAGRAGVGKTTIYRRWSNKEDLVVDALAALKPPVPRLAGVSVRADLVAMLEAMRSEAGSPRTRCVMYIALGETDRYPHLFERFHRLAIEPRRQAIRDVLERGRRTGELRQDLDIELAMTTLSGAMLIHTRWAAQGRELPADLPERIVDQVLRGLAV